MSRARQTEDGWSSLLSVGQATWRDGSNEDEMYREEAGGLCRKCGQLDMAEAPASTVQSHPLVSATFLVALISCVTRGSLGEEGFTLGVEGTAHHGRKGMARDVYIWAD